MATNAFEKQTCPAELRPASHRRAKRAAVLINMPLVDFLSLAADCRSRRVLKKHGLPFDERKDSEPVSRAQ